MSFAGWCGAAALIGATVFLAGLRGLKARGLSADWRVPAQLIVGAVLMVGSYVLANSLTSARGVDVVNWILDRGVVGATLIFVGAGVAISLLISAAQALQKSSSDKDR